MTDTTENRPIQILTNGLLLLILLSGLTLRTWNVNFDSGIGSHPDERSTTCFYAPSIAMPASWEEFKDPHLSPLNPLWDVARQQRRSFTYGHFPLYLGILVGDALHKLAPIAANLGVPEYNVGLMERANHSCGGVAVAGRLTIAFLDTLTILLLFYLGRRMGGRFVGLVAAAFYAFTAQAIQLSHFFAMDPASTTFTVLAILGAVMMVQQRSLWAAILTGVGIGLAIASKFSALPIILAPFVAGILTVLDDAQRSNTSGTPTDGRAQFSAVIGIPVALIVAAIAFLVTSPYAVLDWESFLQATLVEQGRMVRGVADFPFTRQYRNTTPYLYFIEQQVAWGLWWPLGIIALIGSLWMFVELLRNLYRVLLALFSISESSKQRRWLSNEQIASIVVWSWVIPYFGLTGAFLAKFNRYMSPILPFAVLFGALLIWRLWQLAGERIPMALTVVARIVAVLVVAVGVLSGAFWSAAYVNGVYNNEHTWITASRWVYENVPRDSVILWEQWDDPIPKSIPGEPGMDMGSTGLRHIDWGPYEEDTEQKFEIMKAKLREADYVAYSSKRIYDSVDELPERYPMTNLYYQSMWNGDLGFELALDVTSPPNLYGYIFEDRGADESWSLYDHPQVTIFRKVRDLSDAEYDDLFQQNWNEAVPWYRGKDSPLSPFLNLLGLGNTPDSENKGLINSLLDLAMGNEDHSSVPEPEDRNELLLEEPLHQLAVVDDYRWNREASENPLLSVGWWWLVVTLLGWLAWPLCFAIFKPLRDRGYFLSRAFGWLVCGWLLWLLASFGLALNSVTNSWLVVLVLGLAGIAATIRQWSEIRAFLRSHWGLLFAGEIMFAAAFLFFVYIRMGNPDIWQPWFGGEKFMEFAFLNGILRSPSFPPVDPHFAGGFINYYYFGIYLVAYLIKLTGIYAEVSFNLAIPTLFALTVVNAFAIAYSAVQVTVPMTRYRSSSLTSGDADADPDFEIHHWEPEEDQTQLSKSAKEDAPLVVIPPEDVDPELQPSLFDLTEVPESDTQTSTAMLTGSNENDTMQETEEYSKTEPDNTPMDTSDPNPQSPIPNPKLPIPWYKGFATALLAPLFVVILGNLDGFAQLVRSLARLGSSDFRSSIPGLEVTVRAVDGLRTVLDTGQNLPAYDFWGPSRVIPHSINEFPYWSFLFADLHPHLIGIPFAVLFLALVYVLIQDNAIDWRKSIGRGVGLLLLFGLMLGTLASVNLWELPTYFGLGVLAFMVSQYRGKGRINWIWTIGAIVLYLASAYILFWPFFNNYTNVGASGVGLVRESDELGTWLLIWGLSGFILVSWLFYTASRRARPDIVDSGTRSKITSKPTGAERWLSLSLHQFDRLPRLVYLHGMFVRYPTLGYLLSRTLLWSSALLTILLLWWGGYTIVAICLVPLVMAFLLLWHRGRSADGGTLLTALLTATGFAILAGTQIIYLKDFLQGGDWYRMNTLFKFFSQVWVLWGIAAAVALPRIWSGFIFPEGTEIGMNGQRTRSRHTLVRTAWSGTLIVLLVMSCAYLFWGTPARLDQRFPGWRPEFGTLNGLDYMREGVYTWPDSNNSIELSYDWEAIQWLLDNVRGNAVIVETSEVDYYRAGSSRAASLTGLSGLRGMHEGEQRYGDQLGPRHGLHEEFWNTPDIGRTQQLIDELHISLIYVGQLERHLHPNSIQKLEQMAAQNALTPLFRNDRVVIYGVPEQLAMGEGR